MMFTFGCSFAFGAESFLKAFFLKMQRYCLHFFFYFNFLFYHAKYTITKKNEYPIREIEVEVFFIVTENWIYKPSV